MTFTMELLICGAITEGEKFRACRYPAFPWGAAAFHRCDVVMAPIG